MILTTPSNVTFVAPTTTVLIQTVTFDLVLHRYTVVYQPTNGGGGPFSNKTVSGTIPGALQTALENHVQSVIEANEGFGAGTSQITTP